MTTYFLLHKVWKTKSISSFPIIMQYLNKYLKAYSHETCSQIFEGLLSYIMLKNAAEHIQPFHIFIHNVEKWAEDTFKTLRYSHHSF